MLKQPIQKIIQSGKYTVTIASNLDDIRAVQRLRFEVFNIEMNKGLKSSWEDGLDSDVFDHQCDHLLVIENSTHQVIGTYRMQTTQMAAAGHGLYCNQEFYMDQFPVDILKNAIEVGRACIHKDHRNGRVLFLLWKGLAHYMKFKGAQYLFGCCSLSSQDPREALCIAAYLKKKAMMHPYLLVPAKQDYTIRPAQHFICYDSEDISQVELPQLFRLYMNLNAKVCSKAAIDRAFRTIDFLILLDVDDMDERNRKLFFD